MGQRVRMQEKSQALIKAEQTETYTVLSGRADAGLVVLCDHADNAFPPGYGTLGLDPAQLKRHIAYDIGAAEITRQLSRALGVPAVMTHYSRLLIDPNRGEDDPTLIMRLSDGAIVPGNRVLTAEEREKRIKQFYRPYHDAIDRVLDACVATGTAPAILSIHSFTESWKGFSRPWHAAILWDQDPRLAVPLLEALYAENDLIVGDNEPYTGRLKGDTMWKHGSQRGLPHTIIEVRQDLIRDIAGQTAWAERLARLMASLTGRPDLHFNLPGGDAAAVRPYVNGSDSPAPKGTDMADIDDKTRTELEAAAFRKLVAHLRERGDVQNIDLMNLAGFCRNCLANWYQEAAGASGHALTKDEARETIYGMPYKDWQAKFQKEASPAQTAAFEKAKPHSH